MKPTRGLSGAWLGGISRERKTALISLAVMLTALVLLVLYQRLSLLSDQVPLKLPNSALPVGPGTEVEEVPAELNVEVPVASGIAEVQGPPAALDRLLQPLAGTHRVAKAYGSIDRALGDFRLYTAIAYSAEPGESVLAAGPATVAAAEENPLEGGTLLLDHGGGLFTRYAGLGKLLVSSDMQIGVGAIIAQVGEPSGPRADLGTHLQFQVILQGNEVDPAPYFHN